MIGPADEARDVVVAAPAGPLRGKAFLGMDVPCPSLPARSGCTIADAGRPLFCCNAATDRERGRCPFLNPSERVYAQARDWDRSERTVA
jgi:hypothetical protein